MIGIIFEFANEFVDIRVDGNNVLFRNNPNSGFVTIDNLKLNETGVIKEFPDLDGREDWKEEAIKRFKEKIASIETERDKIEYIKEDLKKYGYKPVAIQRQGFRTAKIK